MTPPRFGSWPHGNENSVNELEIRRSGRLVDAEAQRIEQRVATTTEPDRPGRLESTANLRA